MAAIFGGTKKFLKLGQLLKIFVKIALSSTVSEIQAFLCFGFFFKFENSKWPPFLASEIFVETWKGQTSQIPCGSKILPKLLYLARFSRYKHLCVLRFLQKKLENSKWLPFLAGIFFF